MPGFRLFAPLAPLFAWLAADALARLARRWPVSSCSLLLLIFGLRVPVLAAELRRARDAGENRDVHGPTLARHASAARGPVLAVDVGILAYLSDADVVDLGGLTEPRIAYAPGGHLDKKLDGAWLRSLRPGLIVLHSKDPPHVDEAGHLRWFRGFPVERRVLGMEWVLRDYRVRDVIAYAPDYHYVLLVPRAGEP
jgi:hypothetical protein